MDMNKIVTRVFAQETSGQKLENGDWEVQVVVAEKIKETPDSEWMETRLTASAQDKNFDLAHKLAMTSVLAELNRMVYSRGLDSMFEGVLADEEEGYGTSNNNANTSTQ